MENHIKTTLKLLNIFFVLTLLLVIFSTGLNLYVIIDNNSDENMENLTDRDSWPDSNSDILISLCIVGLITIALLLSWGGIVIAIGVLMILSRKLDPKLRSDGMIAGIFVLSAFGSGLFSNVPYFNSISTFASHCLLYGGIVIFLRHLIPERSKNTMRTGFGLIIVGAGISFISRLIDQMVDAGSIPNGIQIFSALFTLAGIFVFLSLLTRVNHERNR